MFSITQQLNSGLRIVVGAGLALALASCASVYRNHGYVPSQEELSEIVPGVDTRDSVAESVGTPSASGVLDNGGYYYVSTRMRHYGARQPEIVSRELVAINFDTAGVVTGVQRFGLEDGRVIPLERRVTSSNVEDKTFLRQLVGNIGRIGPGQVIQ
jgi:outer membrane protein assembly factor BamE (lipoprotein component of BamABCDE complex)